MSRKQALEDANLWLRYASEDLWTAQTLLEETGVVVRHPAWLAQQAAEKALKACLIAETIRFPRTHQLELLFDLIPETWRIRKVAVDLDRLSEFAVDARYPGDLADLTFEEARAAVTDAALLVEAVRADFDDRIPVA